MSFPPNILRLITRTYRALYGLTLTDSAPLTLAGAVRRVLGAFKLVLNGFWCGVLTPFLGWEGFDR